MSKGSGIILAGGRASRMGGLDKGLMHFRGQPLVAHVIARLQPQVDELLINANRETDTYARLGYPVITDTLSGFHGPLAGLQSGLAQARHPLVVMVPCDAPFLPTDLVARLKAALAQQEVDLAVATTNGRRQPVFSMMHARLLPQLTDYLTQDGRKVDAWYDRLKVAEVAFDDQVDAFANLNTPDDLAHHAASC